MNPIAEISNRKAVGAWLLTGYVMVIVMVMLGGITRLTQSGLSIVEWNVIMGTLPPAGPQAWQDAFDRYKEFPEFKILNQQMSLDEFKHIFWWEYVHRLWGRIIGIAFIIPYLIFFIRKKLNRPLQRRLWLIFALGALQALIGWYMVQSGLLDVPHVSHYRLVLHLLLAMTISGMLLWTALQVLMPGDPTPPSLLTKWVKGALLLVIFQIALGGLTAGLKAGFMYNTYPKMGDDWLPESAWMMPSPVMNFLENGVMVQFMHRWAAWLVLAAVLALWFRGRRMKLSPGLRSVIHSAVAVVCVQITLGIWTLLYQIPVPLGVLHQAGAFLLFSVLLLTLYLAPQNGKQ